MGSGVQAGRGVSYRKPGPVDSGDTGSCECEESK